MSKKSSYFKSKKGFSLIELLCAVVIMAIVVSATASGLAVSYKSIVIGGEQDKASAKAQEYCDIIMTYIQYTPANDPETVIPHGVQGYSADYNLLFDPGFDPGNNFKFNNDVLNQIVSATKTQPDPTKDTAIEQRSTERAAADRNDDKPYFIVTKNGKYTSSGIEYISYQVTVYVDYGNGKYTTTCTGSVTKPQFHYVPPVSPP